MANEIIIYGKGGHSRVVEDIARDCQIKVVAFFDDDLNLIKENNIFFYESDILPDLPIIIAIGSNKNRHLVSQKISHQFTNLIHPSALISIQAQLGNGNMIMHKSIIQSGSKIGNHVIINTGVIVEHDVKINDFSHIAPGAILCGGVEIESNVLIGAGAVILPNVQVGVNSIVGAGAIVTRNIPKNSMFAGNPAKKIKEI